MIKPTISKLYSFIATLVMMFEEELEEVKQTKSPLSRSNTKKNITENLNKLVALIIQLNKLSRDELTTEKSLMLKADQEIITRFLNNYHNNK